MHSFKIELREVVIRFDAGKVASSNKLCKLKNVIMTVETIKAV